ncbi:MBL fold metallo-hydrolase [Candidatus Thorarchaeota archaeon]|nr:MAG: MBL fold metallo-hydrolase [Candidatus Thorarchaeota archaeon]
MTLLLTGCFQLRIHTVRSEGLAALSYLVTSDGEAFVIDPRRDASIYKEIAERNGVEIKFIFETHRNEDYVTGSLELQSLVPDCEIAHSNATKFGFGEHDLDDGESIAVGKTNVNCIQTPGHTDDSMCYVVSDTTSGPEPIVIFTGDTIFVNEVGRTDLVDLNKHAEMSRKLYISLTEKILTLDDGIVIHPGHGAGSVCGGAIGDREFSTIGYERLHNPWLNMNEEDFIDAKVNQRLTRAPYFKRCEKLNTDGPPLLNSLESLVELEIEDFKKLLQDDNHQAVDTRPAMNFLEGHIPKTINLTLTNMGLLTGWSLNSKNSISLILNEKSDLEEAWSYLVRVGLDNIIGFLRNGISGWLVKGLELETITRISIDALRQRITDKSIQVLDIREPHEFDTEHVPGSQNLPLTQIGLGNELSLEGGAHAIICPSGNRSTTAASLLKKLDVNDIVVPLEGIKGWKARGFPMEA